MKKSPYTCGRCKYSVEECIGKNCKSCPLYNDIKCGICKCVEVLDGKECPYYEPIERSKM